jgi:hypothetical protein
MASLRRTSVLVVLGLALSARVALAALAFDAAMTTCHASGITTNTASCSFAAGKPVAGALVVVFVSSFQAANTATINSVSDNQTNAYASITSATCSNSGIADCYVGGSYATNVTSSGTFTLTVSTTNCVSATTCELTIGAMSFTGAATATPLDTSQVGFGTNNTTRNTTALVTTNANDVLVAAWTDSVTDVIVAGTGYTAPATFQYQANADQNLVGEYQILAATGSNTPSMTGGGASDWAGVAFALKASGGAAPTVHTLTTLGVGKALRE